MIFIGVTGGIGSGKSTVCSMFGKKGTPVFYADAVAKEISEGEALQEIADEFGTDIIDASKKLDRKKLAGIVFNDPGKLEILNTIVHPRVFHSFQEWKHRDFGNSKFAVVEAALMFESGMFELVDYVLAIVTEEDERVLRISERDNATVEQIKARMKSQISMEELLELSDFQIQNNGSVDELTSKVNFFSILFSTLQPPKELE